VCPEIQGPQAVEHKLVRHTSWSQSNSSFVCFWLKKCWFCLKTKGDPHHDTSNIFEWVAAKKNHPCLWVENTERIRENLEQPGVNPLRPQPHHLNPNFWGAAHGGEKSYVVVVEVGIFVAPWSHCATQPARGRHSCKSQSYLSLCRPGTLYIFLLWF